MELLNSALVELRDLFFCTSQNTYVFKKTFECYCDLVASRLEKITVAVESFHTAWHERNHWCRRGDREVMVAGRCAAGSEFQIPDTRAEKFESFERINSMRVANGSFDSRDSRKQLVSSRLRESHEPKLPLLHASNLSVRNFGFYRSCSCIRVSDGSVESCPVLAS